MTRIKLTIGFLIFSAYSSFATERPFCSSPSDECNRLVACIESTGEYFTGGASNGDEGVIWMKSSSGTECTGNWWRTMFGMGKSEVTCDDKRSGQALFSWFERDTGTVVGNGKFDSGELIRFWTGQNLNAYFAVHGEKERQRMKCSSADMLLG